MLPGMRNIYMRIAVPLVAVLAIAFGNSASAGADPGPSPTAQAQITATCYKATCVGKDPAKYNCDDDATVVATAHTPDWRMSVKLLKSKKCGAVWAKGTDGNYCCGSGLIKATRQISSPYGWFDQKNQTADISYGCDCSKWTPMNQNTGDDRHRACYGACTEWKG